MNKRERMTGSNGFLAVPILPGALLPVPKAGQVALRYLFDHQHFYCCTPLFASCVDQFSHFFHDWQGLAGDKTIVDEGMAAGDDAIGRDQLLMMNAQRIPASDLRQG